MRRWIRRIRYLIERHRLEQELEQEMAVHREMMPPERRGAFGNPSRLREEIRDVWGWQWLDELRQDLIHGVRGFARDRRLAVSALAAIVLAVGGATAVFSVVDRSLFLPLPYSESDRLVSISVATPLWETGEVMFAGAYREWRSTPALDLTSWSGPSACDVGGNPPQRLNCAKVEPAFLPVLGVRPILGRNFTPEEDRHGAEPVALLSFPLWQTNFGADPNLLDKRISLDGTSVRIIGILPATFETPDLTPAEILVPQRLPEGRNHEIKVVGRLRPGHTPVSAAAALAVPFQTFQADFGARVGGSLEKTMRLQVTTLRDRQIRQYRLALWVLLGAVTAFVLIACVNVANLLLARSTIRQQEFMIRTALGASRQRLVRQLLTESGLLALAGGALGCALAWCLLRVFVAIAPDGTLRLDQAALDIRVLTFALLLSLGAALLFGLAPSLHGLRTESLGGARVSGHRRTWMSQALITGQLSISFMLLVAAALLLMSLWKLQNAPLGFQPERIVTASFTLPQYRYPDTARQLNFFTEIETKLRNLPGVTAAAITDTLPPGGETRTSPDLALNDRQEPHAARSVKWRYVTPGYFEALGIPIKRGRDFSEGERHPGELPVILSESFARRRFGETDPVGRRFGGGWPRLIVGVAGDVRNAGLDSASDPEFYVLRRYSREGIPGAGDPAWWRRATAIVRTTLNESAAARLSPVRHCSD